jgi:hypothetical protein
MAGYHTHYEEAHVENEGRADICLHLVNGKVMIVARTSDAIFIRMDVRI